MRCRRVLADVHTGGPYSGVVGILLLIEGVPGILPGTRAVFADVLAVTLVTVAVQLPLAVVSPGVYYATWRRVAGGSPTGA
ncbi:hypothetical protein BRC90_05460 [Halobacteriales archaeon QS_4_69_34]|nr:MAG: hypothetical protein BRC90_05460 [Halobacteriales archaeon QS_4_69_34]